MSFWVGEHVEVLGGWGTQRVLLFHPAIPE